MSSQVDAHFKREKLDTFSVKEIIKRMNAEDKTVAYAVEKSIEFIESAIIEIIKVIETGGRLFYIGSGTSGRLGILDASECPPTFGVDSSLISGIIAGGENAIINAVEGAEDDEENGRNIIKEKVTKRDVVVGITASGSTPFVIGGINEANKIGALTIGVSCTKNSELSKIVNHPIEIHVGPEIIKGSTRLKSGTAQKMVLNMVTTTTMIKLGKVYDNLMVNVRASNKKLNDRVFHIVKEITGQSDEIINEKLIDAQGDARIAILMLEYNVDYQEADLALKNSGDHFRKAMEFFEKESRCDLTDIKKEEV